MLIESFIIFLLTTDLSCKNFYQDVCGETIAQKTLEPTQEQYWFAGDEAYEWWISQKADFLKNLKSQKKLTVREQNLKDFFAACSDVNASIRSEMKGLQAFELQLQDIKTREEFYKFVGNRLPEAGIHFFKWQISPDPRSGELNTIVLNFESPLREQMPLLKEFFSLRDPLIAELLSNKFLAFQHQIEDIPFNYGEKTRPEMSAAELVKKYPLLHLAPFFGKRSLQKIKIKVLGKVSLERFYQVYTQYSLPDLKLVYLLHSFFQEPEDAWPEFVKARQEYEKNTFGISRPYFDRDRTCAQYATIYLDRELDSEILKKMNLKPYRAEVEAIAESSRKAFLKKIEASDFLKPDQKKAAISKLQQMKMNLLAPAADLDWNFLKLPAKFPSSFYEIRKQLKKAAVARKLESILQKEPRSRWMISALQQDIHYSQSKNALFIPFGILRPPVFDLKAGKGKNLGGLATIIGHEMSHGFEKEIAKRIAPLEQKLIPLGYSRSRSLQEVAADFVGLEIAWDLTKSLSTNDQKDFFIQYAKRWCQTVDPAAEERIKKRDVHPAGKLRVEITLDYFPAFAKVFQCTEHSSPLKIW